MVREQLFRYFFLGVSAFLIYQLLLILSPFYTGIFASVVLTLMFYPMHRFILKLLGGSQRNCAAAISSALVAILIILPFLVLTWMVFNELKTVYPVFRKFIDTLGGIHQAEISIEWLESIETKLITQFNLPELNLRNAVVNALDHIFTYAINFGKALPNYTFKMVMNVAVMVFTLFFLFRDGTVIFKYIRDLIPMDERYKDQIANQFYITLTAVMRGVFLVALVQGMVAAVGFYIVGVPSPMIFGFITAFGALIPFVGAPAVWLPIAIYYLVKAVVWKGVFLLLWGGLVVSLIDNFLRVILIGSGAKLPILLLFFGLLGGARVYGPKGIFLGPLVVALVLAFSKIYRELYTQDSK